MPVTGSIDILQRDNYYAFGLRQAVNGGTNKYLYNGKELQEELGEYDYGARFYDPVVGRFTTLDPMCEQRNWLTPYNYVQNNPIMRIDPTGALDEYLIREDGTIVKKTTDDEFDRFLVEASRKTEGTKTIRTYTQVAQLDKNEEGLVKFPDSGSGFTSYGAEETGGVSSGVKNGVAFKEDVGSGDSYLKPETAAALFGVIHELDKKGITISLGDMSSSNGSDPANGGVGMFHHGGHGHMGARSGLDVDFRYIGTNCSSFQGEMSFKQFSIGDNQAVYKAAFRFGFDPKHTYQGTTGSIPGIKTMGGHNNHGHLGYKRN